MIFKSFVFKKLDMSNWAVLILPYGSVVTGFESKDKAIRWSNCADRFLTQLKKIE